MSSRQLQFSGWEAAQEYHFEHNKGGHQWTAQPADLIELAKRCEVVIHATAE